MMQQIMLNTHSQKTNQDHILVGSEAKNSLPTKMYETMAMDIVGLSWIFTDPMFSSKEFVGRIK